MSRWLVIGDVQAPFEHEKALEQCIYIAKHNKISPENVLCTGDFIDLLNFSSYPLGGDVPLTPNQELDLVKQKIILWSSAFPKMKIATSNHEARIVRRLFDAKLPEQIMKPYKKILGMPNGWLYKDEWRIAAKYPFRMIHGLGYSGKDGHRNAALDAGMSTIIGHLHSFGAIDFIDTGTRNYWAFNAASLVDKKAFAFQYGKDHRFKACVGVGLVLDDGKYPIFIPI